MHGPAAAMDVKQLCEEVSRNRGAPALANTKRKLKTRSPTTSTTRPLLPSQCLFVERYLVHRNASRAYREAHPTCAESTARKEGSSLRADPRIAKQIQAGLAEISARYARAAESALDELALLGFTNLLDVLDDDSNVKQPQDIPREIGAAIKRMEIRELFGNRSESGERPVIGRRMTIEFHDKVAPLKALAQHYGLFVERVAPESERPGFAETLEAARKRVERMDAEHPEWRPPHLREGWNAE